MPTKGRDKSVKEKRGRSPLFTRKIETSQQRRLNPSPTLLSTEYRRVPTYDNPTVSSRLHARSPIKQRPSFVKTKVLTKSKVMSAKSKFDETKTKDVGKLNPPFKLKNPSHFVKDNIDVKKETGQMTEVFEKKPRLFDAPSSSKDDRNIVTHEQDDHKTTTPIVDHEDNEILRCEVELEDGGNIPLCEPSVPIDLREDQDLAESNTRIDESINEQHETNTSSSNYSNDHDPRIEDQESQDLEEEQDADLESNEETESKDVEHEQRESGPEEEVPKEEEGTSKVVVKNQQVVAHGKKETAAYNDVREEASMLLEQRRNRVKALVGAFESASFQR